MVDSSFQCRLESILACDEHAGSHDATSNLFLENLENEFIGFDNKPSESNDVHSTFHLDNSQTEESNFVLDSTNMTLESIGDDNGKIRKRKYVKKSGVVKQETPIMKDGKKSRNYRCLYSGCGLEFLSKGHLVRHVRIHNGERPFKCSLPNCYMTFPRSDTAMKHSRNHINKLQQAGQHIPPEFMSPKTTLSTEFEPGCNIEGLKFRPYRKRKSKVVADIEEAKIVADITDFKAESSIPAKISTEFDFSGFSNEEAVLQYNSIPTPSRSGFSPAIITPLLAQSYQYQQPAFQSGNLENSAFWDEWVQFHGSPPPSAEFNRASLKIGRSDFVVPSQNQAEPTQSVFNGFFSNTVSPSFSNFQHAGLGMNRLAPTTSIAFPMFDFQTPNSFSADEYSPVEASILAENIEMPQLWSGCLNRRFSFNQIPQQPNTSDSHTIYGTESNWLMHHGNSPLLVGMGDANYSALDNTDIFDNLDMVFSDSFI
ncbi:transcriptional repressor [Physocladia obscura]|uniref:Transcriptional repressor n=1 Tax=Physocladia obscura TaxID=109957 RepID=A0AAD5SRX0_9FUNG|nr:transcriptional repressor [Physocladia obscura]